jgi:ferritin-like metal-binding protein YciE
MCGIAGIVSSDGRRRDASVLQKMLEEEKATDKKLTTLAESKINLRAAS